MPKIRVNVTTQVNSQQIRRETLNGREHIVIPSRTLPFGVVMNGGLYTREQIVANYKSLEGTLAPLGHPMIDGKFVSATSGPGINVNHVGAFNRNARLEGNRVYIEKWLDIEVAQRSEQGPRLLERIAQLEKGEGEPIHTSVAAWVDQVPVTNADGYQWEANIHGFDHDAILLDEPGAATPEQGVGLMVNADQAQLLLAPNSGALVGETYRERENRLHRAVKERWPDAEDSYAWVADFTDSQVVVVRNGGKAEIYGYSTEGGKLVLDAAGSEVVRHESWLAIAANNLHKLKDKFFQPQARPAANQKEGDMPLTAEEKAELTTEISKALAANIGQAVTDAMKPVSDSVQQLQANHQALAEQLTAGAKAAEAEKRQAVAAVYGEVVANSLQGEALDAMHSKLGTATTLAPNSSQQAAEGLTADLSNLPKE